MRTLVVLFLLLGLELSAQVSSAPKFVCRWYRSDLPLQFAERLKGYDIIILNPEIIYRRDPAIATLLKNNPKVILLAYIDPMQVPADPPYMSPWCAELLQTLNDPQYDRWQIKQPDGKPLVFWPGDKMYDMRDVCPLINGKRYYQFIFESFESKILSDTRIKGAHLDDCDTLIFFLGSYRNHGIDFNRDGRRDINGREIDRSWTKGFSAFIKLIKEKNGSDFLITANPGREGYRHDIMGREYENFPFKYIDDAEDDAKDWELNQKSAARTGPYSFFSARTGPGEWFFTYCSAYLCGVNFSEPQNVPYNPTHRIDLGKSLEPAHAAGKTISRRFEKGTIVIDRSAHCAWIKDEQGRLLYDERGQKVR